MHDLKDKAVRPNLRVIHNQGTVGARTIARVDLSRPGSAEALNEVTADWLYRIVGDEGKRRLLAEHDLLATA